MSNSAQGVYSALPQSISDTDSEEELHSVIPASLKFKDTSKHLNGTELRNYHHLNDSEDGHINGFPNINTTNMLDDSPMIKNSYQKPMTSVRKFFFTLSILICFLTIVVFLWILPCSEDATCPSVISNLRISNWEKPYHGIELMGPISVVKGIQGHSKNLVLLFRGDVVNPNPVQGLQNIPFRGGGAISIMGDTGKVAWYVPRPRLPLDIDCSLLDVDKNGYTDCIMSGAEGMLEVIDPLSGALHWCIHIHNSSNSLITSVDFPLLISDVDGDFVNDLLTSCSLNNSNHKYLVVISGRGGNILGSPYEFKNCDAVHNLAIDNTGFLSFTCQFGSVDKKSIISLNEFYFQVLGKKVNSHNSFINQRIKVKTHTNQRMIYSVNGRQLIVNNQGICPGNCSVKVQLIDQRSNSPGNVIYSYSGKNVYGMVPTSMSFKTTETNINSLQGHVNGFIVKYWQWNDLKTDYVFNPEAITKRNIFNTKRQAAWHYSPGKPEIKRSIPDKVKNVSITEQMLTERVSLITFNSTTINVVNASQSDVKQLCAHLGEKTFCQPDLSLQKYSVLIADLDEDGSKELISYLSTFVISDEFDENNNAKYQLQSSVKVVRLESELPKLYEAVTKY